MKKTLPDSIVQALGLELTDRTVGMSFVYGCVFYKFKNETPHELYLTNYDIEMGDETEFDPDLSKRGVWLLCGSIRDNENRKRVSYQKISEAALADTLFITVSIQSFVAGLSQKRN
jgi:hypothetical protein